MPRKKKVVQDEWIEVEPAKSQPEENVPSDPVSLPQDDAVDVDATYWKSAYLSSTEPDVMDEAIGDLVQALSDEHACTMTAFTVSAVAVVAGHLPEANPDRYRLLVTVFARPISHKETSVQH
jgi:hypothetical protein